jgi:hypothetical protein
MLVCQGMGEGPGVYVKWWYSYPYPFHINTQNCDRHLKKLLEDALIKLNNSNDEDIIDIFGKTESELPPTEEIEDNIEGILFDLDKFGFDIEYNFGILTDSGCLINNDMD